MNCPNCQKVYKSQTWLNKHMTICQVAQEPNQTQVPVIQVNEAQDIIRNIILDSPVQQPAEIQVQQPAEIQVQTPTLADNIKSEQFQGCQFYFTIKAKAKCPGDTYVSPLYKALSENAGKITLCREKESKSKDANGKAKAYKSYGNMTLAQLNNIWEQNNHLYEVIKAEHKPYFDIEFKPNTKEEKTQILYLILRLIKTSFEKIGVPYSSINDSAICKNVGTGEAGVFAGLTKASFHLIINNGYKFVSHEDSNKFSKYLEQRIRTEDEYKPLITTEGIAIDLKVYNKNRCFKLPNQSKAGSTRIQTVSNKFSKTSLTDFLISEGITDAKPIDVSSITLTFDSKIKKIKGASNTDFSGVNWNWSAIEEFKNSMVNVNHIVNIDGEPSYNIEYLVDSIYNGKEVTFKTWLQVGSAIKRCVEDSNKALELFAKWTRKYDASATTTSIKPNFDSFSSDTCGFKTLLSLARICNPKLDDYINNIHKSLFVTDKMPSDIINIEVNKRYIDFADFIPGFKKPTTLTIEQAFASKLQTMQKCISPKTTNTFFIKSAMGTGKTFNFINYIKQQEAESKTTLRVIYLSSRRAFAEATSADFKSVNLVSYLKYDVAKFSKVIISLESINRLTPEQINENDILVVDESESIFNIFSSATLINAEYIDKIKTLNTLIKKSKQVFCMDAFLTNRSIQSIMSCRPVDKNNTIYYVNTYKYAERQYVMFPQRDSMISDIKAKLVAGKRVCLVSGSSNYGQILYDAVKTIPDIKIKYYNAKNPLCLTADVNTEWADCNLLIYSPTITCGISYTNDAVKFDNLYIYATNKGSCHFRDIIQAHKRIRNFTDNTIGVFLNTEFTGFNAEQYPTYCDEIKQIYSTHRKELFNATNNIESILDNEYINWVYDIHCYNIMERNIHSVYLEKVARHYFELENIKYKEHIVDDNTTKYCSADKPLWKADEIPNITVETYELLTNKVTNKTITEQEYKQWAKFWFKTVLKDIPDEFNNVFNDWFHPDNVNFIKNIIKFNTVVKNNGIVRGEDSVDLVELFDKNILAMEHTFKILKALKVITHETITTPDGTQKPKHTLNTNTEFNTLDLESLVTEYKTINSKAINQLFSDEYLKTSKKGKKIEFSTRTMRAILDKLLKENFGYQTINTGESKITVNGERKKITKFSIIQRGETNLFAYLK